MTVCRNALRPLLDVLTNEQDDDVLSDEELASFLKFEEDMRERPQSFVSIAEYKERRGFA